MTVTYELPTLDRIGSLRALTLTREDGSPDADVGSIPARPGNSVIATP